VAEKTQRRRMRFIRNFPSELTEWKSGRSSIWQRTLLEFLRLRKEAMKIKRKFIFEEDGQPYTYKAMV